MLREFGRNNEDWHDTLDVLLTVATLPEHPLNADFLDKRLRRDPMPDRDAWWTVYLHRAWGQQEAVDRLVDWASSLASESTLDEEVVDLCATALSWMLTSSNRFLRDRATKALVNLLTGRLGAVLRLVERFADIDDLYLLERVYAVAYGTAMRSDDCSQVGRLAEGVYGRVFANGAPHPHILLRDYARGVVERAINLGAGVSIVADRVRPPYASPWLTIPTEDDIKPLSDDSSLVSYEGGSGEWARLHIVSSVMRGDFACYVIGTNSWSTNWLSLRLAEPRWRSADERIAALLEGFSEAEKRAWIDFKTADDKVKQQSLTKWLAEQFVDTDLKALEKSEESEVGGADEHDPEFASLEQGRTTALEALNSVLTEEQARALDQLLTAKNSDGGREDPPRFDLGLIQRYVVWRVFDLGWTVERFGDFDRHAVNYMGRRAAKAERIGKKYQWIAYHEIMALVADHYQYREEFRGEGGDQTYEGPWQTSLRDIDPSCTLRKLPGGTSWHGHSPAWWGSAQYKDWGDPDAPREWVTRYKDLPNLEDLLMIAHPDDGTRWLNVDSHFNWQQQRPVDREWADVEKRELWYSCTGYLIRARDRDAFIEWAEGVDFWGRWMPDPPEFYHMFLGEHQWSPASRYFQQEYFGDEGWTKPQQDCPVEVRCVGIEYLAEVGGFDCSVDDSFTLRLPASDLIRGLGLRWSGKAADYVDGTGQLVAFDPTAHAEGPSALLLRQDSLEEFLKSENLTICWAVLGEKRVFGPGWDPTYSESLRMTGAYTLGEAGLVGFLKCILDDREEGGGESSSKHLSTIRSPESSRGKRPDHGVGSAG